MSCRCLRVVDGIVIVARVGHTRESVGSAARAAAGAHFQRAGARGRGQRRLVGRTSRRTASPRHTASRARIEQPDRPMSTPHSRLAGPLGGLHPAVLNRRIRDLLLIGASGLIPAGDRAGRSAVEMPHPNLLAGSRRSWSESLGVVALMLSTRYEITLTLLALYLGLLDGPVKLESASQGASAIRDVLILAISARDAHASARQAGARDACLRCRAGCWRSSRSCWSRRSIRTPTGS